ncbi:hypothetical membrane protein [Azoarcus olearius]|uniref:Hypothetical membrane protein n=2 Tax=Azoarcus sp. (strain BH72) TaxID=418699 RepID=A1K8T2_AZOSB|nr:hypothetical membrane protein [Azoarcus olearius]
MSSQMQARLAALVAVVYVLLVLGGSLVRIALTGDFFSLRLNFVQPVTWLVCILGLLIAWGLWRCYAWAWWLGLGAVCFQLYRFGSWVVANYSLSHLPGSNVLLALFLLLVFLLLLLLPGTRAACSR